MRYITDNQLVICPYGTFFSDNKCFANPVKSLQYIVYPKVSTDKSVQWVFTYEADLLGNQYNKEIGL